MAGYLDHYGAGEERREKILKTVAAALAVALVGGGILFFIFHNYRQEQQVKRFFDLIASHDYKSAYTLWGCTEAKPCDGYPYSSFLQDWGPASNNAQSATSYHISKSRSCDNRRHPHGGSGVQPPGKALGEARRSDDRILAFSRLPGASLTPPSGLE